MGGNTRAGGGPPRLRPRGARRARSGAPRPLRRYPSKGRARLRVQPPPPAPVSAALPRRPGRPLAGAAPRGAPSGGHQGPEVRSLAGGGPTRGGGRPERPPRRGLRPRAPSPPPCRRLQGACRQHRGSAAAAVRPRRSSRARLRPRRNARMKHAQARERNDLIHGSKSHPNSKPLVGELARARARARGNERRNARVGWGTPRDQTRIKTKRETETRARPAPAGGAQRRFATSPARASRGLVHPVSAGARGWHWQWRKGDGGVCGGGTPQPGGAEHCCAGK